MYAPIILMYSRIGLAGTIGADDRSKVRIAEKEYVMTLVGLEI
jgi:hypothetical protein